MARVWSSLPILLVFVYAPVSAALEFISAQESAQLKADFGRAQSPKEEQITQLANRDLKCDMYGVRSHLQVERGVNLYRFQYAKPDWKNLGAQVIPSYRWVKSELIGQRGEITDKIRFLKGQLISQLSVQGSSRTPDTVLAYSVCKIPKFVRD